MDEELVNLEKTVYNKQRYKRLASYYIVAFVLITTYILLDNTQWKGNTHLHTIMEIISTLLALFVGVVAIIGYYTNKVSSLLLLGVGFIGTSLLDVYHAIVTSSFFYSFWPSPPPSLIPWSWNASRIFLALTMLLSWWVWYREDKYNKPLLMKDRTVYTIAFAFTLLTFLFFLVVPLPDAYYPSLIFGRPEEFVPGIFFIIALIGFYKKGMWVHNDVEHWIVLSLVVNVVCQVLFMSSSYHLFDTMFDVAHALKKFGYILVLTGLLINMYQVFRKEKLYVAQVSLMNKRLISEVAERQEAEERLNALTQVLEDQKEDLEQHVEALAQSNVDLEEFAYVASHDLKSPLRAIENLAQWIEEDAGDELSTENQERIALLRTRASRLGTLLANLLEYSRAGQVNTEEEEVDVRELISSISDLLPLNADKSTIRIDGELPVILTHRIPLEQVFRNLIENAIKHHDHSPQPIVTISSNENKTHYVFAVADNGEGIPPEHLERIFKLFNKLKVDNKVEGSGMGLALAKKLVEKHGGTISARNAEPNGCIFAFTWKKEGRV